jgi:hypothetical protein
MEQALWGKAQEWEEVWVEEPGIVRAQAPEGIVYVLLAEKRLSIRQGHHVLL